MKGAAYTSFGDVEGEETGLESQTILFSPYAERRNNKMHEEQPNYQGNEEVSIRKRRILEEEEEEKLDNADALDREEILSNVKDSVFPFLWVLMILGFWRPFLPSDHFLAKHWVGILLTIIHYISAAIFIGIYVVLMFTLNVDKDYLGVIGEVQVVLFSFFGLITYSFFIYFFARNETVTEFLKLFDAASDSIIPLVDAKSSTKSGVPSSTSSGEKRWLKPSISLLSTNEINDGSWGKVKLRRMSYIFLIGFIVFVGISTLNDVLVTDWKYLKSVVGSQLLCIFVGILVAVSGFLFSSIYAAGIYMHIMVSASVYILILEMIGFLENHLVRTDMKSPVASMYQKHLNVYKIIENCKPMQLLVAIYFGLIIVSLTTGLALFVGENSSNIYTKTLSISFLAYSVVIFLFLAVPIGVVNAKASQVVETAAMQQALSVIRLQDMHESRKTKNNATQFSLSPINAAEWRSYSDFATKLPLIYPIGSTIFSTEISFAVCLAALGVIAQAYM